MFTLVRDRYRNQDPLFPVVSVPFPVSPPILVPCSVNTLQALSGSFTAGALESAWSLSEYRVYTDFE